MQLKEDYPDLDDPEYQCFKDYKSWGLEHEFLEMRPKPLTDYQNNVLHLFYKCRVYSDESKSIPLEVLNKFSNCDFCEPDICQFIISGIDSKFLKMCSDKIKRDLDAIKSKGRQQ